MSLCSRLSGLEISSGLTTPANTHPWYPQNGGSSYKGKQGSGEGGRWQADGAGSEVLGAALPNLAKDGLRGLAAEEEKSGLDQRVLAEHPGATSFIFLS